MSRRRVSTRGRIQRPKPKKSVRRDNLIPSVGGPRKVKLVPIPKLQHKTIGDMFYTRSPPRKAQPISEFLVRRLGLKIKGKIKQKLPFLGLRSLRVFKKGSYVPSGVHKLKKSAKAIESVRKLCRNRKDRRKTLFIRGIAGKNKRRSPGAGGTYKRTPLSEVSC